MLKYFIFRSQSLVYSFIVQISFIILWIKLVLPMSFTEIKKQTLPERHNYILLVLNTIKNIMFLS